MSEPNNTSPSTSVDHPGDSPAQPILALVIGINEYPVYGNLNAAVPDADRFAAFLTNKLNVPAENITNLRDEQATREAIIDGFLKLRDDVRYRKDEAAIVIYYAGHGAQVPKPTDDPEWDHWATNLSEIEMLCPHDVGMTKTVVLPSGETEEVVEEGIPDRTISLLLNHISDLKGNNITLILDCCSSAGLTRGDDDKLEVDDDVYITRQIKNPPPLKSNKDRKFWTHASRGGGVAEGFQGRNQNSHVMLAACGRDQFARESVKTRRGLFTFALLKALESEDISTLTYTSLMHKLRMPPEVNQTPHCQGQAANRCLFNNLVSGADDALIVGRQEVVNKKRQFVLYAGMAQGITSGSILSVHKTNLLETSSRPNPSLGKLVVTSVSTFKSGLSYVDSDAKFAFPATFYAKLIQQAARKIRVYCEDETWLRKVIPEDKERSLSVEFVGDAESSDLHLVVDPEKKEVTFHRHHEMVNPHIGSHLRQPVDIADEEAIRKVISGSLHFYHHLDLVGTSDFRNVWMELTELKDELSEDFEQVFTPIGKNLIETTPAVIVVDENKSYGMTIFNQTDLDLYPYLFYFDPNDLSIIPWYLPASGAGADSFTSTIDVPLPARSRLTIGYGDGGASPWQFMLLEDAKKDMGIFKLYLATHPIQLSNILQEGVFEEESFRAVKVAKPDILQGKQLWGTKTAVVIQVDE
ncbi:hypothetical protein CVT24_005431 [Panaeolus cyanescens]|uniref:Peptidase C14 caspase domain-containing protein n=1 Tax=Panaeolus cyanescens TaxID=181874 RepID=A0A409VQV7_9AGAR|nr:hypothetical protein CVT24_005431 [Panaeolus cyanescens]